MKGLNMPKFEFKCNKCGNIVEDYMFYEEAKRGFPCECGGYYVKQFSKANIIGANPYIYKPGLDPAVERMRAQRSMEERVEQGEYIRVGNFYRKVKKKRRR